MIIKVMNHRSTSKTLVILCWIVLIGICLYFRDQITVERIVSFTPESQVIAALVMLCLFAVKSVSVFIYGGILYAASGILFPLPGAIAVNILGSVVMTTIPYFIGRKAGTGKIAQLVQKYPRLEILRDAPSRNGFFTAFFVRIIGILPSDIIGMYLGSTGIPYGTYICGTILGMLPAILSFSIMGMSAEDMTSPAFILSVCFELGLMLLSLTGYFLWRRKSKHNQRGTNPQKDDEQFA